MIRGVIGVALAIGVAGCGPAHQQQGHTAAGPKPVAKEVRDALALPPRPGTGAALETLKQDHRSCEATWLRSRYLLDLFDWVRLLPRSETDRALQELWRGCDLAGAAARGRIATGQVVTALEALMEQTAKQCEEVRTEARAALSMLRADQGSRSSPRDALQVAVTYRRIVGSDSPLAPNARLRLVDWCAQAFRLAAGGDPAQQHLRLNHCLFALFPADPAPYFAPPALRPPDPPWTVLRDELARARDQLLATRLAPLARRLSQLDKRFFELASPALPAPLHLTAIALPRSPPCTPWDRTPVVVLGSKGYVVDGRPVLEEQHDALEHSIALRLHNDDRRRITVAARRGDLASRVLVVGRAAKQAGATTIGLGVAREVTARPTPGDVQQIVFGERPVLRLEEIPVSLALLSATAPASASRSLPRGLDYDPRSAEAKLSILITRAGPQLASRDGRLASTPLQHLAGQLEQLRRVYPEDRSMVIAPDATTTYEDLVAVARVVREQQGRPLFPGLALAQPSRLPAAPERDLAPLLRLLATARVELQPMVNRSWPALARQCYLDALRRTLSQGRPLQGTVRVGRTAQGVRIIGGTLRDPVLRQCLQRRLAAVAVAPNLGPFTFTFSR